MAKIAARLASEQLAGARAVPPKRVDRREPVTPHESPMQVGESRERRERGCGWVEMNWVADVGRKHPGITQVRARESSNRESV
jgi:hypothetical protein